MGSPYNTATGVGGVSAVQVGSYFVAQYYQVLQQQPRLLHQFYSDSSSLLHVDDSTTLSASSLIEIHNVVTSLNFTAIEIKNINSLPSLNGSVLVVVSGCVKTKEFPRKRNFVQTFFLGPQDKGFFILNDIFQFIEDAVVYQQQQSPQPHSLAAAPPSENMYAHQAEYAHQSDHAHQSDYAHHHHHHSADALDAPLNEPASLSDQQVSDYGLVEEAAEYVSAINVEYDHADRYSLPDQQQQQHEDETEIVGDETLVEEIPAPLQDYKNVVQDAPAAALEEPLEEPQKKTYASILRAAKAHQSSAPAAIQLTVTQAVPSSTSEWNHTPPPFPQPPESGFSFAHESTVEPSEEGLGLDEGEPKSVYVRNLPSDITAAELEHEFKNFGKIIPDGIFIRNRKDVVGVCYAFVEFEDLISVQNAIKASPIQLAGRQIYIEERRPNSGIAARGGRGRGRGRGSYPMDASRGRFGGRSLGRGSNQDGGDYNRPRGNGYYHRGSQ